MIGTSEHLKPYAKQRGIEKTRITNLLPLVNLGPEAVRRVLTGEIPPSPTLDDLLEASQSLGTETVLESI